MTIRRACSKINTTNLIVGSITLGLGVGLGVGLVLLPDGGTVQVVPNSPAPTSAPRARLELPALALRSAF